MLLNVLSKINFISKILKSDYFLLELFDYHVLVPSDLKDVCVVLFQFLACPRSLSHYYSDLGRLLHPHWHLSLLLHLNVIMKIISNSNFKI